METDSEMMNNVKQPLSLLEIEIPVMNPIHINKFSSKGI